MRTIKILTSCEDYSEKLRHWLHYERQIPKYGFLKLQTSLKNSKDLKVRAFYNFSEITCLDHCLEEHQRLTQIVENETGLLVMFYFFVVYSRSIYHCDDLHLSANLRTIFLRSAKWYDKQYNRLAQSSVFAWYKHKNIQHFSEWLDSIWGEEKQILKITFNLLFLGSFRVAHQARSDKKLGNSLWFCNTFRICNPNNQ